VRYHARLIAIALAVFAVSSAAEAYDRALVVGINHYPGIPRDGVKNGSDLAGAVTDAERFAGMLTTTLGYQAEDVKLLTDAQATREGILDAFQLWLIDGTQPGDRVMFYFAGHGTQEWVPDGSGGRHATSSIVPADARLTAENQISGLIFGTDIGALIKRLSGRDVTIVADSCHSGSISRDPRASAKYANARIRTLTPTVPLNLDPRDVTDEVIRESKTESRFFDPRALGDEGAHVAVWSAVTLAQVAMETTDGGVFTNALLAGLRDRKAAAAADAPISVSALLNYARQVSAEFCAGIRSDCPDGLTPELLASDSYRARILVPVDVAQPAVTVTLDNPLPPPPDAPATAPPIPPPSGQELVAFAGDLLGHGNDFDISAEILPGPYLTLGDKVKFRILSQEAGELVVLDTGPDGELRRIFPNGYTDAQGRRTAVRARATLTIPDQSYPFDFTATDAGKGTLIVLVAEPGTDLDALLDGAAFDPVVAADRAFVAVAANLQETVLDADPGVPNRARRWAFQLVPYEISP
jgi:metacaspase-1